MLLFLVLVGNLPCCDFYVVTHFYSSRPFICALVKIQHAYSRCLLNDLLVSSLDTAVSLKQVKRVAMLVTKYLDFYMPVRREGRGRGREESEEGGKERRGEKREERRERREESGEREEQKRGGEKKEASNLRSRRR